MSMEDMDISAESGGYSNYDYGRNTQLRQHARSARMRRAMTNGVSGGRNTGNGVRKSASMVDGLAGYESDSAQESFRKGAGTKRMRSVKHCFQVQP